MGHGLVGREGHSGGCRCWCSKEAGGKPCPAGRQMAGGGRRKRDGAQGAWVKPSHLNRVAFSSSQSQGQGAGAVGVGRECASLCQTCLPALLSGSC